MGFLTNVSISNDFWHEINKDPQRFVDAISIGMNDGIEDPLNVALSEREDGPEYRRSHDRYVKANTPQGVTVHRARHYDDPQVIVNTYGSHAIAANELPQAISHGWLEGNKYREQQAERVVAELRRLATEIDKALARATDD